MITRYGVNLREIKDSIEISTHSLKERFESRSSGCCSRHFIAVCDGLEIAFVTLDLFSRQSHMFLYALFVPKELRQRGFGTNVLLEVENRAKDWNYKRVFLHPKPIDEGIEIGQLKAWYSTRGYSSVAGQNDLMEKAL